MKTPYDAALRLRQREIDEMRIAIGTEVGQQLAIDADRDGIDMAVRRERALVHAHHGFSADPYVARMRAERERLGRERAASEARLADLRARTIEAFGSLGAISAAAESHRDEVRRTASLAEQSQIDDFSAARFTRASATARRRRIDAGAEA